MIPISPLHELPDKGMIYMKSTTPDDRSYYLVEASSSSSNKPIFNCVLYSVLSKRPLACFPHKKRPFASITTTDENVSFYIIREFIQGISFVLFYDDEHSLWELSTSREIGGHFYINEKKEKTLREMFFHGLSSPILDRLDKDNTYTFILCPRTFSFYLVAVYFLQQDRGTFLEPNQYENEPWFCEMMKDTSIQCPKTFQYKDVKQLCSIHSDKHFAGCMFTNIYNGENYVLENPRYNEWQNICNTNRNLQYFYLCLRNMNKVEDFLNYFPKYRDWFWIFYTDLSNYIINLHQSYLSHYIQKSTIQISGKYFPLMEKIHREIYLPSLKKNTQKIIIKKKIVREFVYSLTPGELLYYLRM